jgi:hypothetical protein
MLINNIFAEHVSLAFEIFIICCISINLIREYLYKSTTLMHRKIIIEIIIALKL